MASGPVQRRRSTLSVAVATSAVALLLRTVAPVAAPCWLVAPFSGSVASSQRLARTTAYAKKQKGGGKKGGGDDGGNRGGDQGGGDAAPEVDTAALLDEWEDKMVKAIEVLKENLVGIRAGKASPAMVNEIKVPAYGSEMNIIEVATVTMTDSRTLTITCFEEDIAPGVAKKLIDSNLGYSIQGPDGASVKVQVPELTTDKRKEYSKLAKDYAEKTRVAVRNVRQAAMKKIKGLSKKLSEDDSKGLEKDVEATVKKQIKQIDDIFQKKEKELLKA